MSPYNNIVARERERKGRSVMKRGGGRIDDVSPPSSKTLNTYVPLVSVKKGSLP